MPTLPRSGRRPHRTVWLVACLSVAIVACTDTPTAAPPQPTALTPSLRLSGGWPRDVRRGCAFSSSAATPCGFTPTFETPIYPDTLVGFGTVSGVVTRPYSYYARHDTLDLGTPIPAVPIRISFQPAIAMVRVSARLSRYTCYDFQCINGSGDRFRPWVVVVHEANGDESRLTVGWGCGYSICGSGTTLQSDVGVAGIEVIPPEATLYTHLGFTFLGGLRTVTDSVVLTCPAQVQRASTATCTAAAQPASASLTELEWHFVPDDSTLGPDIRPRDGAEVATTWAGPMVASGTVRVQATVDGTVHEATAHITVTPRDWSADTVKWTWKDGSPGDDLPDRPDKLEGQLGHTHFDPRLDASAVAYVTQGPNSGLVYLTAPPATVALTGEVNTKALEKGSAFWRAQLPMRNPNVNGRGRAGRVRTCTRADVERIIPLVRLRQGTAKRERDSHVDTYLTEFNRMAREHGEGLVSAGDLDLAAVVSAWHDAAVAYAKHATDSEDVNPMTGRWDCVFNFTYSEGAPK